MNEENPIIRDEAAELLSQLSDDPGFLSASQEHEAASCELDDEDGPCAMCFALEAVHTLFHVCLDLDPIEVIHSAKSPADHIRMSAIITQWLSAQIEDFAEFLSMQEEDEDGEYDE